MDGKDMELALSILLAAAKLGIDWVNILKNADLTADQMTVLIGRVQAAMAAVPPPKN